MAGCVCNNFLNFLMDVYLNVAVVWDAYTVRSAWQLTQVATFGGATGIRFWPRTPKI